MRDLRTDLEIAIDQVVEKYAPNEFVRKLIESGEHSLMKEKYGLNFDRYSSQWCFRSAKPSELISYGDYDDDQQTYVDRTENIENFLISMMVDVRNAINNTSVLLKEYQSYSKFLAAPLFKYKQSNGPLIIDELHLNSLDIHIDVHCFDWLDSYDNNGNRQQRNYIEDCSLRIPFTELFSKDKLLDRIYDELSYTFESKDNMVDVDNITIGISDLTLDISCVNRNAFDSFFQHHERTHLKRHASYRKDREVLTTRNIPYRTAMVVQSPKAVQTLRFIYLLKIGNWYSGQTSEFITNLVANKYPDILQVTESESKAMKWVLEYLSTKEAIHMERAIFLDTFNTAPQWNSGSNEFIDYFIRDVRNLSCLDLEFGDMLLSGAFNE